MSSNPIRVPHPIYNYLNYITIILIFPNIISYSCVFYIHLNSFLILIWIDYSKCYNFCDYLPYHYKFISQHNKNNLSQSKWMNDIVTSSDNLMSSQFEDVLDENLFNLPIKITLITLAVVSSVISLLIPALYFVKRKCTEHPSSLIAIISLLQALSNYNVILIAVNIYQFQQFVHIKNIFDLLVLNKTRQPSQTQFCQINFAIYILLELMSIAYNIAFSADLLVTLKKPFFAGKKRMKFYHLFCVVVVACGLPMSIVEAEDICRNQFNSKSIYRIPFAFFVALSVFYFISFAIIIMSFCSVQTSQIRIKYIRLHRIILFTLIFLWAFPMATNIMIILGDQQSTVFHIFNLASFISLLVSGGMINIVRFYNDTYVWLQIKNMITQCDFKEKKKQVEDQDKTNKEQGDIWNLPLAHAVSTFHHQSVISNIIQIVLETCVNAPQQIAIQRSDYHHQPEHYYFNSTILSLKDIKKMLKNGNKDDTKKLAKITKTLQMVCLQRKHGNRKDTDKNIYKAVDFIASYSSEKDVGGVNASDQNSEGSKGSNKQQTLVTHKQITACLKQNDKAITIKVKSYADPVFLALRLVDNFSSDQLSKTLNLTLNAQNIKKARQSLGASGSFFFFSFDHKLVIKTISEKQCHIFLKILPEYYEHILKYPNSLISRTYGLFSVEIAGISKIYFIMMENTLRTFQENDVVYKKYDLKGSTIKREVKNMNADVFKDINFLKSDDAFLFMSAQRKKQLIQQIKADITLFSQQNIMDYSLLLGVGFYKKINKHHMLMQEQDLQHSYNEWRCFDDGHQITGKVYSLSLIDYLQQFDIHKYMELKLKKIFKGGGDISSVDTPTYYQRFLNFVTRIIVVVRK